MLQGSAKAFSKELLHFAPHSFLVFTHSGQKLRACMGSKLASHPATLGLIPSIPEFFSEEKLTMLLRLINGAGDVQWLENVDRAHLFLASGKPVQQKKEKKLSTYRK